MKSKKICIRINNDLLSKLCTRYSLDFSTANISDMIKNCVKDCILEQMLYTKCKRQQTPLMTLNNVKKQKKDCSADTRISVRIDIDILEYVKKYYNTTSQTTAILCCIYDVLNNTADNHTLTSRYSVFYMVGQKNPQMQEFLNSIFNDIKGNNAVERYIEPFTGTANVLLHSEKNDTEFINDNSSDLINLLRVIQRYPFDLKFELLKLDVSKETFDTIKHRLLLPFSLKSSKKAKLDRAVAFYFCRYASVYGRGESYKKTLTQKAFLRKLDTLSVISKRLEHANIKKNNALYFSKSLCNSEHQLIYIDAPYIKSEEHYKMNNKKNTVFSSHTALRNKVEKLRKNNICLISYRITASATMRKNGITDKSITKILDRLFCQRNYYYILKPLKATNGQVEILLSTHPFNGATPYAQPLS